MLSKLEKPNITEYEVTPVKPNLHFASLNYATFDADICHCWHSILWTEGDFVILKLIVWALKGLGVFSCKGPKHFGNIYKYELI